jgi:acetyltransferase-like isoleucine patch superfamily enzyme
MARTLSGILTMMVKLLPKRLRAWLFDYCASVPGTPGTFLRYCLARSLATAIGEKVHIGRFCTIIAWDGLRIGDRVSLHEHCYVHALGGVNIGNDVSIAHDCSLISFEHGFSDPNKVIRDQPLVLAPVWLESDIWLGCGVRVLAGVRLGQRTVVAAGSVVTKSNDGNVVLAGIPARPIKMLATNRVGVVEIEN